MACLQRISRICHLRNYVSIVRNLTSNCNSNVNNLTPILTSQIHQILENNSWIYRQKDEIKSPILNKIQIDFPNGLKYQPFIEDPKNEKTVELPSVPNQNEPKQATRMIVVRRKKMKRHKLKKLRKRLKFEMARRRQKREWNKEKAFQAVLINQCKEGEAFSAEKYVEEKLSKLNNLLEKQRTLELSQKHNFIFDKK